MKKITKAVILCTARAYVSLNKLALKVKNALILNASTFPGTATLVATLGTDQANFATYIAGAKGNATVTNQRNELAPTILADLQALLIPVNAIAKGNTAIIALSGFPNSADPTPQSIPAQVVIKRIVDGPTTLSAKIFIESLKQSRLTYTVRTTTVAGAGANDPSWKVVLQTTSSRKLIIPNLTHLQEIYIDVCASNAHGTGLYSDPMAFNA
jgi:hypothetical protein